MSRIGEYILKNLSFQPDNTTTVKGQEPDLEFNLSRSLNNLQEVFPNFEYLVANKEILDFGCGKGLQSIAILQKGAKRVIGLDTDESAINKATAHIKKLSLDSKAIAFHTQSHEIPPKSFDLVLSHNSFEHFSAPEKIIDLMISFLKPDGQIMITFGPLWNAPYGAHMNFFTKVPWVHLFFSEETIMKTRALYRSDGARHFEEVKNGLNKMTLKKFEKIIYESKLQIIYKKYDSIKHLNWTKKIPILNELLINRASVILKIIYKKNSV